MGSLTASAWGSVSIAQYVHCHQQTGECLRNQGEIKQIDETVKQEIEQIINEAKDQFDIAVLKMRALKKQISEKENL